MNYPFTVGTGGLFVAAYEDLQDLNNVISSFENYLITLGVRNRGLMR